MIRPAQDWTATLRRTSAQALGSCLLVLGAAAQGVMGGGPPVPERQTPVDIGKVRAAVGFDQKLGAAVPLELEFLDESGARVALRSYFGKKPVVLTPVYYGCPMLCTQVLNSLTSSLRALSLEPGKDFEIVSFSINPAEGPALAAEKKQKYIRSLGKPESAAGWHFLAPLPPPPGEPRLAENGESEGPGRDAVRALAGSVGFRYWFDRETGQYAHEPGFVVLTPDGKIAKYFFGLEYDARDLRFALIEASEGKVGSVVDQILMLCFHYDPTTGKYGFVLTSVLRLVGAVFLLFLGGFIFLQLRRDRRASRVQAGGA